MRFLRRIFPFLLLVFWLCPSVSGQESSISGIINKYAAVQEIHCDEIEDVDSVTVFSLPPGPDAFAAGDTVMLYCVQGANIHTGPPYDDRNPGDDSIRVTNNVGKYAILIVDEIAGNTVVFNNSLNRPAPDPYRFIRPMRSGDRVQLIKVKSYTRAVVDGTLTAPDWNPATGTGGVVAMFVTRTLRLNADIDVSGKGFTGADESRSYTPQCSSTDLNEYDSLFYLSVTTKSGLKGEGTTRTDFPFMRGRAKNINGGGGGNGRFSGGGGGGNFSAGGQGGRESSLCSGGVTAPMGIGGFALGKGGWYYLNESEDSVSGIQFNRFDRVFFGGGGGTGTSDQPAGRNASPGGDGGGIVVIVADSIIGDGTHFIRADGESVTSSSTAGAGGGGGGGAIVLDVSGYRDNVRLSAIGGDGGNTNHATDQTGPGGGGGGGIYWLAGADDQDGVLTDNSLSLPGTHTPSGQNLGASGGLAPSAKGELEAPIRGFVFNSVPTEYWACSNLVPKPIIANEAKGGSGVYTYEWRDSSATQNSWEIIPGATGKDLVFGSPLSDTTYFRRVVKSGSLDPDWSFRIAVYVHPAITGNTVRANDGVAVNDEVCLNDAPLPFVGIGSPGSGNGEDYTYRWLVHEGDGQYVDAAGTNNNPGYDPPALSNTSYFARSVESGACIDTSAEIIATVHPLLTGNNITPFDTICWNTAPSLFSGPVPGAGKPGDKRYRWESSSLQEGPWTAIGATSKDYQSPALTENTWFRRVALSGTGMAGDACVDFSEPLEVLVVDTIENNTLLSSDETVCTDDIPALLSGSQPGGGYQSSYSYRWERRTESGSWENADATNPIDEQNYQPPLMSENGVDYYFRRIVGSGGAARDVCTSTSGELLITVLPRITNNNITTADAIKCQLENLDDLLQDGPDPGGGASDGGNDPTRFYKWEQALGPAEPTSGWTQLSYGQTNRDYTDKPQLDQANDYWYRRIVFSGPLVSGQEQVCADTTAALQIVIHSSIVDFTIDQADSACFQSTKELSGLAASGEEGFTAIYQWREEGGADLPGTEQNYPHLFSTLGPYSFERVVSIGECTELSNAMPVTVMELPGATLSADIPSACEKDTLFNLALNTGEITNFMPTTSWEVFLLDGVNATASGPYNPDDSDQIDVTLETHNDAPSTTYTYTLEKIQYYTEDGEICVSPSGNLGGSVGIEVFNKPRPLITIFGEEISLDSICGSTVDLEVDPDYGTGSWYSDHDEYMSYSPEASATDITASIDESDAAWAAERYMISFRSEAGDCYGIDTVEVLFFEQPEPAYAGGDTMAFLSNSIRMNADPASAGEGTWTLVSGSGTIVDPNDPNTQVTGLEKDAENTFNWEVVNGNCISSEDISIVSHSEAWRPEGISPNGDGLNDYLIIRGLAQADEFRIIIFNNLGKTVREVNQDNVDKVVFDPALITGGLADNELVVWDGLAENGNPVPAGTYYYVMYITINQDEGGTDTYEHKDYIVVRD